MSLTPNQRAWLQEQQDALQLELDGLLSGKALPGYPDKNERRLDLLEELEEINRQLREDQ